MIPTETSLVESYGCARTTVNRALRELAEAGVVERRRKSGTRVLAAAPRNAKFEIPVVRLRAGNARGRGRSKPAWWFSDSWWFLRFQKDSALAH